MSVVKLSGGLGVAALFALGAGLASFVLSGFGIALVVRVLIALGGFIYLLLILGSSRQRHGRVSVCVVWLLLALGMWIWWPSLLAYLAFHVISISIVRSLYHHDSLLAAATDLALCGLSLAFASWAYFHSGSVVLAVWSFFLGQAMFVWIRSPGRSQSSTSHSSSQQFFRAERSANEALAKLFSSKTS